jgi:Dolichyl-phosphate-mannose-protein mannosyltransferase
MNQSVQVTLTTCALLLAAVLVLANIVTATYGLDSIRMIQAFNTDEGLSITRMKDNLEKFSIDPDDFFYYGNLYHSIAYYCIAFLEGFGWTINTSLAGFVLRLVSIVSGFLASLSLWKLGKICNLPTAIAAGTALALLTMPDFVVLSRMMHPDVLQTVFVIASLGTALLRPTFSFALISAVFAGLAFSTKYVGALVLPFSFLPLQLSTLGREQLSLKLLLQLFLQGLALFGVFLAVFVLTNPYAAFDRSRFISVFLWQIKYSSTGYGVIGSANPALWLEPLTEQFGTLGVLYLFGGFFLACVFLLRDIGRAGWRIAFIKDDLRTRLVLVLYVLTTSAHLMISIHQREVRFTYHVVPFLMILSTMAVFELIVEFAKRIAPPRWITAALAASLLVFASTQIRFDLQAMAGVTAMPESDITKLGNFIAEHYPADTKILADSYTYLPPSMTNVTFTNLQTEELLNEVAPQAVVLTRGATGTYVWKKTGTAFSDGKFVKDLRYPIAPQVEAYLSKLLSPSSGWSVVWESDFSVLLQRKK